MDGFRKIWHHCSEKSLQALGGRFEALCTRRALDILQLCKFVTVVAGVLLFNQVPGWGNELQNVELPHHLQFTAELVGMKPFEETAASQALNTPIQLSVWQESVSTPAVSVGNDSVAPPALLSVTADVDPISTMNRDDVFAPPVDIDFGGMVKWTVIVCLLGLGAVVALKKAPRGSKLLVGDRSMQIVETISLGTRGALYLVEVHSERYLAATDANGVKSLTLVPNWDLGSETPADKETFQTLVGKSLNIVPKPKSEVA